MTDRQLVTVTDQTVPAMAQVCYELADAAYPGGSPWQLATFKADMALTTATYNLLRWQGQLIGFISHSTVLDESEITNVAIAPAYQRQGHAQWLLMACLGQLPAGQVFLEVRASNVGAQQLYQRCGFQQLTLRSGYYHDPGEDAWIMRKIIE